MAYQQIAGSAGAQPWKVSEWLTSAAYLSVAIMVIERHL
jgi:hypothetical protein